MSPRAWGMPSVNDCSILTTFHVGTASHHIIPWPRKEPLRAWGVLRTFYATAVENVPRAWGVVVSLGNQEAKCPHVRGKRGCGSGERIHRNPHAWGALCLPRRRPNVPTCVVPRWPALAVLAMSLRGCAITGLMAALQAANVPTCVVLSIVVLDRLSNVPTCVGVYQRLAKRLNVTTDDPHVLVGVLTKEDLARQSRIVTL